MQIGENTNSADKLIQLDRFRSRRELESRELDFGKMYASFQFHQLIEESHELIDRMKSDELDVSLVVRSKALFAELRKRCSDKDQNYLASMDKMQTRLQKKIDAWYASL